MKVLVIGATGFTGSSVVPLLLAQGARVRCMVRPTSNVGSLPLDSVDLFHGDLDNRESIDRAMRGTQTLACLASLEWGHAAALVSSAVATGIRRAVFFSTTQIFTTLDRRVKAIRLAAEESIRSSGLRFTILRPTMIYGGPRDRNMSRLIRFLERWPAIPVFGSGEYLQQPVYVEDVASAVRDCLATTATEDRAYNLAGASKITYNQVIDTVCGLLRRKVRKIHLPAAPFISLLSAVEAIFPFLPLKADQIRRLNEDKQFDFSDARRDFNYQPRSFEEGIRLELQAMGLARAANL